MKLVVSGGVPSAVPGLRLPAGALQLTLTRDNGMPSIGERIWLYAMEGGGGFGPVGSTLQSDVEGPATIQGGVSPSPELVLGPRAEPNRFTAQARNAHADFTINGSWKTAMLNDLTPVRDGLCHDQVQVIVELRDSQFPASAANPQQAAIFGARLMVEVTDCGGFLVTSGPLVRAAVFKTDFTSRITFGFRLSSRAETSIVRVAVMDAPGTYIYLKFTARAPRLLSSDTATRAESTDTAANTWLSKLVRVGTADLSKDQVLTGPLVSFVEIGLSKLTAGAVYPVPRAGWGGISSLMARPPAGAKGIQWEMWLPDFPDDAPIRTVSVPSQDRYSGPDVGVTTLPYFIESYRGGTRDDAHGVEISKPVNDVQHLGPNATTTQPFQFSLATKRLAGAPDKSLLKVKLRFKVRMTPSNSLVDDPLAGPDDVPGMISLTQGGPYADEQYLEIQVANPYPLPPPKLPASATQGPNPSWILPGTTGRINLYYKNSDRARDCDVEVTATTTIEQKVRDPQTSQVISAPQTTEPSTLLARAFFPCPRLSFTKIAGKPPVKPAKANFVSIDDEGIIPVPLIDPAGNVMVHDTAREFYLEYRAEDPDPQNKLPQKPTVSARAFGGGRFHDLVLTKFSGTPECAIFRSPPIVCYLERPEPDGLAKFDRLDRQNYQAILVEYAEQPLDRPYGLSAYVTPVLNNPKQRTFWTPIRPLTFLNLEPAGATDLAPALPAPEITLDGFNTPAQEFLVTLDKSVTPPLAILAVTGSIRDVVGDLTPLATDRINQVTINGAVFSDQTGDVTHSPETNSKLRPHAGYEKFTGKVSLKPGFNIVKVSATNKLGVQTTRTVQVEVIDSRNAFDNETTMRARVTVTAAPVPVIPSTPLALVHYRTPHTPLGTGHPATLPVTVQSLDTYPKPTVLDQIPVTITRDASAKENVYISDAILVVPEDSTNPQRYDSARRLGIQLIRHVPGTRLLVSGTLRTPVGDVPLQNLSATSSVVIRMLVQQPGGWTEQERLRVGDHFTFEADYPQPMNPGTTELLIESCDRLGRVLPGPDRRLMLVMSYDAASLKWTMTGYEDLAHGGQLVNATQLVAVSRHGQAPGEVLLRVLGGGTIQAADRRFWGVDHDPARQPAAGGLAAQESMRGTSARTGARQSVVAATGEFVLAETDAALRGRGLDLAFQRDYHSFLNYDGPIGPGWNHALHSSVRRLDPDTIQLLQPDGRIVTFGAQTPTLYHAKEPGVYATLEIEPDSGIGRLRWNGGYQDVFVPRSDREGGLLPLMARYDRCGNRVGLIYNQSGLLIQAADPLGQRLYLHHDERQRVDIVGDGTERVWAYAYYDGVAPGGLLGDLQKVTAPAITWSKDPHPAATHVYSYETAPQPKQHKIKEVQDPLGIASALPPLLVTTYDAGGRAETQTFGQGRFVFQYAAAQTTIMDRRGNKHLFDFKPGATGELSTLAIRSTRFDTGGTSYQTTFDYNGQGELKSVTPPPGSMTPSSEFDYHDSAADPRDRGNILRQRGLAITGLAPQYQNVYPANTNDFQTDLQPTQVAKLEWVYDYGSVTRYQQPLTVTDPLQRKTTYVYDFQVAASGRTDGNLLEADQPPVSINVLGGTQQNYTSRWVYNNYGQPLWQVDPAGVVTKFEYWRAADPNGSAGMQPVTAKDQPAGHLAKVIVDSASPPPLPQPVTRSASLTPAEERRTTFYYDPHGYARTIVDPRVRSVNTVYDELGRLKHRDAQDDAAEDYFHDMNGRMVRREQNVTDLNVPASFAMGPTQIVTGYDYDRVGNLTATTVDKGHLNFVTKQEYDESENLTFVRTPAAMAPGATADEKKRYTKYEYDGLDRLTKATVAPDVLPARSLTYEYYPDGKTKTVTDANKFVTTLTYNAWGYRVEETGGDGSALRTWRDALGHVTVLEKFGSLDGSAAKRDALARTFVYLDEHDREVAHAELVFRYDASLTRKDIGRRVTQWIHDPAGNVTETVNARQLHTVSLFNGHGQLKVTRNTITGELKYDYDPNGNLRSTTSPGPGTNPPIVRAREYDAANRLKSAVKAGGGTVRYYCDSLGRLRATVDQLGNGVGHTYDGASRKTSMSRDMHHYGAGAYPVTDTVTVQYVYDSNSNLLQVIDGDSTLAIEFEYDTHEQVGKTTFASDGFARLGRAGARRSIASTYHPNGLLHVVTGPDQIAITHDYTSGKQLKRRQVTSAAAPVTGTTVQTFTYDGAGRCIAASDDNGDPANLVTGELRYDSLDNLWEDIQHETISGPQARAVWPSAEFNAAGELAKIHYPVKATGWNAEVAYSFDTAGRPGGAGDFASYSWAGPYPTGRTNSVNHLRLSLQQTPAGLPQDHVVKLGAAALGGDRIIEWNETALPLIREDAMTTFREDYVYDSAYRLKTVTQRDANYKPTGITSLSYDRRGNPTTVQSGASSAGASDATTRFSKRAVNGVNQIGQMMEYVDPNGSINWLQVAAGATLVADSAVLGPGGLIAGGALLYAGLTSSSNPGSWDYTFDMRGNVIATTYNGQPRREYTYDAFNRLISASDKPSGVVTRFYYDAFGRRVVKDTTAFRYLGKYLLEEVPGNAAWFKDYVYGADDLVGFVTTRAAWPEKYAVHDDRTGSIVCLSDENDNVRERYSYDAFGAPTFHDFMGRKVDPDKGLGNFFLHQGQYYDIETGLYCIGSRYYDPFLQRFLQPDALGCDLDTSRYAFAANNSRGLTDASGNWAILALIAAELGVEAALLETAVVTGLVLGVVIEAERQTLLYLDTKGQSEFSLLGILAAGALGATAGFACVLLPAAIVLPAVAGFTVKGVIEGVHEFEEGHTRTGAFDIIASLMICKDLLKSPFKTRPMSTYQRYFARRAAANIAEVIGRPTLKDFLPGGRMFPDSLVSPEARRIRLNGEAEAKIYAFHGDEPPLSAAGFQDIESGPLGETTRMLERVAARSQRAANVLMRTDFAGHLESTPFGRMRMAGRQRVATFAGNIADFIFKEAVQSLIDRGVFPIDDLQVTPTGTRGADVWSPGHWAGWDLTSWESGSAHVKRDSSIYEYYRVLGY
jgi:RHS repeat-associated protein